MANDLRQHTYTERIHVDAIDVGDRLRVVDDKKVDALAASIREVGLHHPVTVRVVGDAAILVAGAHRLKALKKLGFGEVDCLVIDGDDDDATLWECDENLARSDLTPGERAQLELKRREAVENKAKKAAGEESTKLVDSSKPKRVQGQRQPTPREDYVRDTAKTTGRPATTIRRDLERGEKVAPDVLTKLRENKSDTGVVLDALKVLKPEEQRQVMARVDDLGETPKQAIAFIKGEEPKRPNPVKAGWLRATEEEQAEFINDVIKPMTTQCPKCGLVTRGLAAA